MRPVKDKIESVYQASSACTLELCNRPFLSSLQVVLQSLRIQVPLRCHHVRVRYQVVNKTTVWKRNIISYKRGREHNLKHGNIESLISCEEWRRLVSLTLFSAAARWAAELSGEAQLILRGLETHATSPSLFRLLQHLCLLLGSLRSLSPSRSYCF